jgi:signal peptidase I
MKNLIFWLLFATAIIGAIYAVPLMLTKTLNSESPTLVVISNSMFPVLKRGDLIFIQGTSPEDIKVGEVVVFRHGAGLAVHRIISIQGEYIITKGDANIEKDQPITYEDIVGRVPGMGDGLLKIPYIGSISIMTSHQMASPQDEEESIFTIISRYVWNPLGFSVLVLIPATLFFSSIAGDVATALSPKRRFKQRRKQRLERLRRRRPKFKWRIF